MTLTIIDSELTYTHLDDDEEKGGLNVDFDYSFSCTIDDDKILEKPFIFRNSDSDWIILDFYDGDIKCLDGY